MPQPTRPQEEMKPKLKTFPARKCDNCGTTYKPTRALRPKLDRYGFCKPDCKKSFHKNGGAYRKLKGEMEKMVDRRLRQIMREEFETLLSRCTVYVGERVSAGESELYGEITLKN